MGPRPHIKKDPADDHSVGIIYILFTPPPPTTQGWCLPACGEISSGEGGDARVPSTRPPSSIVVVAGWGGVGWGGVGVLPPSLPL
jgi:hypothetical protein